MCSEIRSLATAAFLGILATGCSLFEPREPEQPGGGQTYWQPPTTPSRVMLNMDGALEARSIGLYMECMDTSFVFLADPADTAEYGGTFSFDDWDWTSEQNTVGNIFASVQGSGLPAESLLSVAFSLDPEHPDPPAPTDSAVIWRNYSMVVAGSGYAEWGDPALGQAKITLVEDDFNYWKISLWEDFRPDDYTEGMYTWGVVKASYR